MKNDPNAFRIIKAKYWNGKWIPKDQRSLSSHDEEYLAKSGFSFGSVTKTHDHIINEIRMKSASLSVAPCLGLLSGSLTSRSSRYLKDRSFVSSVLQAKRMPDHKHTGKGQCNICGLYGKNTLDIGVMVFEKIMWGGVRLTDLRYILVDLSLLGEDAGADTTIFSLSVFLDQLSQNLSATSTSRATKNIPLDNSNKEEREVLCGILGICGILTHPKHQGFVEGYVEYKKRLLPDQHFVELEWPFSWCDGGFEVNLKALGLLRHLWVN
jgi:hypothetical protein